MKVWEYLDFFARCYGIPAERRRRMIGDLLDLVDLGSKRDTYVQGLSRGMQQRLCLAHTLVHDPAVLVLDEPASGLDPRARIELRELLRELRSLGKTILISSHILPELEELCTAVAIVDRGQVLAQGRVADIEQRLRAGSVLRVRLIADGDELEAAVTWFGDQLDVASAQLLVRAAAAAKDRGEPLGEASSLAKWTASDVAMRVTTDAVQLFGGTGYSRDTGMERLMRDAKGAQIYEGTNQIHRLIVADAVLERARPV